MRTIVTAALAAGFLGASQLASPALAQYDPGTSRGLNQVDSLNRSMMEQQQTRAITQQQQFETNALRGQIMQPPPPPLPAAPAVRR